MLMPSVFRQAVSRSRSCSGVIAGLLSGICVAIGCSPGTSQAQSLSARRPEQAVKLVFIHHSCGENWLADSHGGLGQALSENNYFVSDTNYGWGPDGIGDRTDITDWPEWFTGRRSSEYLQALYREGGQHCEYTRTAMDPGGENEIVMFKSCFPNSNLEGSPADTPARGEGLSVANAKAIYSELLKYFATRPDKLFVVVTAPPVQDRTYAANARAFNKWLVEDWLTDYRGNNVAVFDFYNVLTGPGSHHRFRDGKIEHICHPGVDTLYNPTNGDDHPPPTGNRKATEEFVPLLNVHYNKWSATAPKTAPVSEPPDDAPAGAAKVELPPTVEAPPQAEPKATSTAGQLIDDFEQESRAWTVFLDSEKNTRLTFAKDKENKHKGAMSLHVEYDLAPESWATCSLVYDRPQDWSRFRGLSLYLHAEKPDQPITIVVYGGKSADELVHFDYRLKTSRAAVDGWQRIDIAWPQLKPPEWQGDSRAKYDPRSAMGVALALESSADGRRPGELWIDDVSLD